MTRTLQLDDRYTVEEGSIYLSGVQALVRLPLDIHRHDRRRGLETAVFISGYEGSPLAGYDLELLRRQTLMREHAVTLRQGLNEELAANAVQGTQLALGMGRTRGGVSGLWYGKAPGLDRASDAIRHSNLSGTHASGGVLAIVGDDSLAKSSTVPSSSESTLADLGLPTFAPVDAQDVLDLGIHALTLSRVSGLWAGFKISTNVADGSCSALAAPDRVEPILPDVRFDGVAYQHRVTAQLLQPTLGELEHNLVHRRLEIAKRYSRANRINQVVQRSDDDTIGIVAAGSTYLDVRQALRQLGRSGASRPGIRVLRIGMVWPLEADTIREFAQGLREIIVVEEKRSFLETAIKELLYSAADRPAICGKQTPQGQPLLRPEADLTADLIATALASRLAAHDDPPVRTSVQIRPNVQERPRPLLPLATRTPFFCSGCPHNRSTETPDGSLVGAGIGCHGMVALMRDERVGEIIGLSQMGGEGAAWIGMAPYVEDDHLIQNLGDGTFHHSGSLAIRAAVAAGVNITYKLLYNSTVAMTGGQTAVGQLSVPAIVDLLFAEGVKRVVVTTDDPRTYRRTRLPNGTQVRSRDDMVAIQEELARIPGVTVLIHDQECAAELRRKRKRGIIQAPAERAFINQRVCEGCGDCGEKSNCLSVQPVPTEFGRKTVIHQSSCNQDMSCLDGDCPSFLSITPGREPRKFTAIGSIGADAIADPVVTVPTAAFALRITGVGGTGVVTVAQIVSIAAVLDGYFVRALDQTGLAQKGGAVVSDVKVSTQPLEQAGKLAAGECDLYLGCDLLVAAVAANLVAASPERTVAVVSTAEVPTGAMVTDPGAVFPNAGTVTSRIKDATDPERGIFVDAHDLTGTLFGDNQYANIFLLGVALQSGLLPISAASLEAAIELNGVAAADNLQALRRGRQFRSAPAEFAAALAPAPRAGRSPSVPAPAHPLTQLVLAPRSSELERLVRLRVGELVKYQNDSYARRYVEVVERMRKAEDARCPGASQFTEAVARNLFTLMAYKDEYEVARLSLDPDLIAELKATFGEDVSYTYRLHPPILRSLGMKNKVSLGSWFRVCFTGLYAARRVRGTRFDPFGYARVRRVERQLIQDYLQLIDEIAERMDPSNHHSAVELAQAADLIRGYETVKLRNVERYQTRINELRTRFEQPATCDPR
jgi:indolepyruvate ferredoxin oxidoreductase